MEESEYFEESIKQIQNYRDKLDKIYDKVGKTCYLPEIRCILYAVEKVLKATSMSEIPMEVVYEEPEMRIVSVRVAFDQTDSTEGCDKSEVVIHINKTVVKGMHERRLLRVIKMAVVTYALDRIYTMLDRLAECIDMRREIVEVDELCARAEATCEKARDELKEKEKKKKKRWIF